MSFLPYWGTTHNTTCLSHATSTNSGTELSRYRCIAWFSQKKISNKNTLNTEFNIITCKKRRNIKDLLEIVQCLFRLLRALKILFLGYMNDWWQTNLGSPSPDINGGLDEDQRSPFYTLSKVQPKAICVI